MEAINDDIEKKILEMLNTLSLTSAISSEKVYSKHRFDKKVTVKHFLNERINLNKDSNGVSISDDYQKPLYPLYVQITFNRKTTMVRSATRKVFTFLDYTNALSDDSYLEMIKRESDFIEFHFQQLYRKYLFELMREYNSRSYNSTESKENYVEEKLKSSFDIGTVLNGFSYKDHEIHRYVNSVLFMQILDFMDDVDKNDKKEKKKKGDYINLNLVPKSYKASFDELLIHNIDPNISPLNLITFLEARNGIYSELRRRFASEIWNFDVYYGILKYDTSNKYYSLGATILDFIKGDFKKVFLKKFNAEKYKAEHIVRDINQLVDYINTYSDDLRIFD